jgi:hypothetical protein
MLDAATERQFELAATNLTTWTLPADSRRHDEFDHSAMLGGRARITKCTHFIRGFPIRLVWCMHVHTMLTTRIIYICKIFIF